MASCDWPYERSEIQMMARCRECGASWNISIYAKIPKEGYICPWCRSKKKTDNKNEKAKGEKK